MPNERGAAFGMLLGFALIGGVVGLVIFVLGETSTSRSAPAPAPAPAPVAAAPAGDPPPGDQT